MVYSKKKKNIFAGTGISKNDDPYLAGKEAVEKAMSELGNNIPTFGIIFCSGSKYGINDSNIKKLVNGVNSLLSNIPWGGCTTNGEIFNGELETNSCICLLLSSEYMRVGIGIHNGIYDNAIKAGELAVEKALNNLKLERVVTPYIKYTAQKTKKISDLLKMYEYTFLVFSTGHTLMNTGHEDEVIKGITNKVGRRLPIIGGTAGDDFRLLRNYQFANGEIYYDAAVVFAISTGLRCGFGYDHGYVATGKSTTVTKSEGYFVHELDGKPALSRYAELLGLKPEELWDTKSKFFDKTSSLAWVASKYWSMAINPKWIPFLSTVTINPFGVTDVNGNLAIRIAKSVKDNSVMFTQKIPNNIALTALEIDPHKVLDAEKNALNVAVKEAGDIPAVIFIFDCELRKIYTGADKIHEAISKLKKKYPTAKIFGFNTMGEFTFSKTSEPNASSATVSVGVIGNKLVSE